MTDRPAARCVALRATAVRAACLSAIALVAAPGGVPRASVQEGSARAADSHLLQYATVNGVRLAYRLEGSGFPAIFVHGESHSHEAWTEQVGPISARYTFLSYDRRGHGASDAPFTGYSPLAHMHDLRALMRHLGFERAHFVVSSRGGAIVLQLLRLDPGAVRSVAFIDATIPLVPLSEAFVAAVERYRRPAASLDEATRERDARRQAPFYSVARTVPRVAAILSRMIDQHSVRIAMNPRRGPDLTSPMDIGPWNAADFPDMAALRTPVLIVVGAETDPYFLEGARLAAAAWPGARHEVVERADHLVALEAPDRVNQLLLGFWAEVDGRPPRGPLP